MYSTYRGYPNPYFIAPPMYSPYYSNYPNPYFFNPPAYDMNYPKDLYVDAAEYDSRFFFPEPVMESNPIQLKDYGPQPFVVNINDVTKQNNTFRTALWTGEHLQVTLMSIDVGDDIGLEIHPEVDQFIRLEDGEGLVKMGKDKDRLDFQAKVYDEFAIMIPAGTWHNVINTGNRPLKVYSIYAPPQHPHGTVHQTKADAQAAE
ncbi:cupin domain-containing protein [Clostridium sp. YIM B02551]|uniref:cupin domain-containing protein n=1 Tax=Clostridium sp. YIM B02551 TaxID=2910679 RepID=UPI001EEBB70A|nr:cupin domain-containing protein [Clostridium sp. YIM B02551]